MKIVNRKWTQAGCLLYILGVLSFSSVSAMTAREHFNPAAREYIHGNNAAASNLVTQALIEYPTDEQLKKLKELIEQQQEQQQQDQDQQNQDQQNQDQQDQQDSSDQQQNQDEQEQEQDPSEQQDPPNEQEEQDAQPSPPQQAGEMSEEEAQQLLDAMKLNEKDQRADLRPYLGQPVRVDKDW